MPSCGRHYCPTAGRDKKALEKATRRRDSDHVDALMCHVFTFFAKRGDKMLETLQYLSFWPHPESSKGKSLNWIRYTEERTNITTMYSYYSDTPPVHRYSQSSRRKVRGSKAAEATNHEPNDPAGCPILHRNVPAQSEYLAPRRTC